MRSIDEVTELAGNAGSALNGLGCFLACRDFEAFAALVGGSAAAENHLREAIQQIGRFLALPFTSGPDLKPARAKLLEVSTAADESNWIQLRERIEELLALLGIPTAPKG